MTDENEDIMNKAKADQHAAFASDILPNYWWRMFQNMKESGFTEGQAFDLLKIYIHGCSGGKLSC